MELNQAARLALLEDRCVEQKAEIDLLRSRLDIAKRALEKYADPERHSMDPSGFVWSGDYFDYKTARKALEDIGGH